jgi:uncharacterized protein YkwD
MRDLFFAILFFFIGAIVSAQTLEDVSVKFDQQEMLELVNDARMEKRRCGGTRHVAVSPLKWDDKLAKAAQKHADDMADNDFFEHKGSDKSSVVDRIEGEKYLWRTVGENLAMGPRSVSEAVEGWLESPGHCSNIMNGDFTEMGVALSNDWKYWVQVFGAPR